MKLEAGMYVRSVGGRICKISKIVPNFLPNQTFVEVDVETRNIQVYDGKFHYFLNTLEDIKGEPSYNIIDLIEVGDIITYEYPTALGIVTHENVTVSQELLDILQNGENNHEYKIKSIVTKEQFEEMEYKI